jgi:hypothetical protein
VVTCDARFEEGKWRKTGKEFCYGIGSMENMDSESETGEVNENYKLQSLKADTTYSC